MTKLKGTEKFDEHYDGRPEPILILWIILSLKSRKFSLLTKTPKKSCSMGLLLCGQHNSLSETISVKRAI